MPANRPYWRDDWSHRSARPATRGADRPHRQVDQKRPLSSSASSGRLPLLAREGEQLTVTLTSRRETTDHSVFHSSKLVGASRHRVSIVLVGWMSTGRRRQRSRHLGRHRVKGLVVDNADVTEPVERHIINSHHQYDRVCLRMSSANGDRTRMDCAIGVDDHLRRTMSGLMVWRTR